MALADIAQAFELSLNHLNKVCQKLVKLGLVNSFRGQGGGIELAPEASKHRLGDLMKAMESNGEIAACNGSSSLTPCPISQSCSLRGFFSEAQSAFYENLNLRTVADLTSTSLLS